MYVVMSEADIDPARAQAIYTIALDFLITEI